MPATFLDYVEAFGGPEVSLNGAAKDALQLRQIPYKPDEVGTMNQIYSLVEASSAVADRAYYEYLEENGGASESHRLPEEKQLVSQGLVVNMIGDFRGLAHDIGQITESTQLLIQQCNESENPSQSLRQLVRLLPQTQKELLADRYADLEAMLKGSVGRSQAALENHGDQLGESSRGCLQAASQIMELAIQKSQELAAQHKASLGAA